TLFRSVVGGSYHWIAGDLSVSDSEGSVLAAARYGVLDNLGVKLSWSRKVRAPSIRNLYEEATGNRDLEYETIDAWEGGIEYQPTYWSSLAVSLFHMDVEDFIERNEVTDLFDNVEESRLRGVEVSGRAAVHERLGLYAAYSHLDAEDRSGTGRDELQNRPRHIFAAAADVKLLDGLGLNVTLRHVADQVFYSRRGPLVKAEQEDFTLVNARLRWRQSDHLEFYLGADNLFDEDYEEEYGLPSPGRFVYGGLKWWL